MRPVLPSSSPREPFFPAIRFNPCDPQWVPQDLRQNHMVSAIPTCKSPPILATAVRGANARGRAALERGRSVSLLHLRQKNGPGARSARAFAVKVVVDGQGARAGAECRLPVDERSARALYRLFDGLVGLFGKLSVHPADLRELMHVAVVGSLGKAALDLDCLLEGLGRQKLLEGCRALLKGALGIVGHFGGDRLPTLVPLTQDLHGSVHVVLA